MSKIKIFILCAVLSFYFLDPVQAGENAEEFLLWGVGAKAIALGQAYTGVVDDADAIYYNPAGLVHTKGKHLATVGSAQPDFDMQTFTLKYTGGENKRFYGISVLYLRVSDILKTDKERKILGNITASNYALTLSSAKALSENRSLGFTIKLINQKIPKSYNGAGVDIGYLQKGDNFSFGVSLQNVLSKFSDESSYPLNIRTGIGYTMKKEELKNLPIEDVKISFDINKPEKRETTYHLGVNAQLSEFVQVRLGQDAGNFVAGVGFKFINYQIDYAYSKNLLGDNHRVSISTQIY